LQEEPLTCSAIRKVTGEERFSKKTSCLSVSPDLILLYSTVLAKIFVLSVISKLLLVKSVSDVFEKHTIDCRDFSSEQISGKSDRWRLFSKDHDQQSFI
jgi:hypothetical protein